MIEIMLVIVIPQNVMPYYVIITNYYSYLEWFSFCEKRQQRYNSLFRKVFAMSFNRNKRVMFAQAN